MKYKSASRVIPLILAIAALTTACQGEKGASVAASMSESATALSFSALDVGNAVDNDQTVRPTTMFVPTDKIIASVRTKGAAKDLPVAAKLIAMANGQALGELSQKVTTTGAATTNLEFGQATPWPVGRYVVEVAINGKLEGRQEIEVREQLPGDQPKPSPVSQ